MDSFKINIVAIEEKRAEELESIEKSQIGKIYPINKIAMVEEAFAACNKTSKRFWI